MGRLLRRWITDAVPPVVELHEISIYEMASSNQESVFRISRWLVLHVDDKRVNQELVDF